MANTIKIKAAKATKAQLNSFARQALNGTLPDMPTAWECLNCGGTGKGAERSEITPVFKTELTVDDSDNVVSSEVFIGKFTPGKITTPACSCWHFGYVKFETFMDTGKAQFTIIAKGNGKLPFYAFSILPGFTCPGAGDCLVIKLTAGTKDGWCYSFKAWRYPAAFFRQLQNTILIDSTAGRQQIMDAFHKLPQGADYRHLVDGDFRDLGHMSFAFRMLMSRPDVKAYGYSKSWPLFLEWAASGKPFPSNYVLNLSGGSKYGEEMANEMRQLVNADGLPVVRDSFLALPVSHKMPAGGKLNADWRAWAQELRATAAAAGMPNVWPCPGKCGDCAGGKGVNVHACGSLNFNMPVIIGIH